MAFNRVLLVIILVAGCKVEVVVPKEEAHHLRCTNDSGTVVVDTTDLYEHPWENAGYWYWKSKDETRGGRISVPPYKCVYVWEEGSEQIRVDSLVETPPW